MANHWYVGKDKWDALIFKARDNDVVIYGVGITEPSDSKLHYNLIDLLKVINFGTNLLKFFHERSQ
jgi:hypothetical protein